MLQADNFANEFIDEVNAVFWNFGLTQPLNYDMSATNAIAALNLAFSQYQGYVEITPSMNAETVISTVSQNLSLIRNDNSIVKFLHISDLHNAANAEALTQCKTLMDMEDSISFTFLTGDYTGYNGSYGNLTTAMQSLGNKILMLNGNHDVYDGFSNNQASATLFLKSVVTNENVHWGDNNNIASYYYYDIVLSSASKLRIFSLDSYDYQVGYGSKYDTIYSQDQVDWFAQKIVELRPTDYFIIAMHEPPVNASTINYSYNVSGKMDDDIVALRRSNNFCSSRLWVWDTSLTNGNLFPMIVNAYKKQRLMDTSVNNTNSVTGGIVSEVLLDFDFRYIVPATFLFYIGGHLHGDFAEYHPDFQDQLILLVDCANSSTLGNSSDIGARSTDTASGTRSDGVLINGVEIDFANEQTTIFRIGQNAALSYNGFPAITRGEITFPFTIEE